MKITKKLAKDLKDYIKKVKRNSNLVDKQLVNNNKEFPFIIYRTDEEMVGFDFKFTTEEALEELVRVNDPKVVAYTLIDKGLYLIFEEVDYNEIDLEEYIEKTTHYIQNTLIARTDADDQIKEKRKLYQK